MSSASAHVGPHEDESWLAAVGGYGAVGGTRQRDMAVLGDVGSCRLWLQREKGLRHGFETCYRRDMDSREDRDMGLRLAIVETWIRERIETWV